ncbi:hypothetical protein LIER_04150 [Lithospermum erythrorhizon]|uniref:Uncharacterized protein n=1 Tax=Lithospermum erythrorhizon TaxID=34254 RepID=A0AAV3NWI4_LITER
MGCEKLREGKNNPYPFEQDKVLKLTEEDVHRVYKLRQGHRRVDLTRCIDEEIRNMKDELGISGIKKSIYIFELEDKLDSLDDPTAWAKAVPIQLVCGHVLNNLREGIREHNKLNPLGDMHFILINYLERIGKGCRLLSGNYTSPSLRKWNDLKVTKAMEQVDEIIGFSKRR